MRQPIRNEAYGDERVDISKKGTFASDNQWNDGSGPIILESITIRNFKCINELDVDFTLASELAGNWACIAGINGAGKSSILQAVCILLLGNKLATDLGSRWLGRTLRRESGETFNVELFGVIKQGGNRRQLYIPINSSGIDENRLRAHPQYQSMQLTWERLRKEVLVSYGATRNLSEGKTEESRIAIEVERQWSLFNPLTQIASANTLFKEGEKAGPAQDTLMQILQVILYSAAVKAKSHIESGRLVFDQSGAEVEAIELPDGFRSTVAWLADLCATWHAMAPEGKRRSTDPRDITGIVLLDEIDLHLHPSFQRSLVPLLRRSLPNVQFIVTTHSPMLLASFDRSELILLDRESEGGVRKLDRQIFGFSMDDVYEWLMRTSPESSVVDDMLKDVDENVKEKVVSYLYQSKDADEEEAQRLLADRERVFNALREDSEEQ